MKDYDEFEDEPIQNDPAERANELTDLRYQKYRDDKLTEEADARRNAETVITIGTADDFPEAFLSKISEVNLTRAEVRQIIADFGVLITPGEVFEKAYSIVVTDESQTELMEQARSLRIRLKNERNRIEKLRKEKKEPLLRQVQALDGSVKIVRDWFESAEAHLRQQEEFAERLAQQRKEQRIAERTAIVLPLVDHIAPYVPAIKELDDEGFDDLLDGLKELKVLRENAEREEAERKRREAEAEAERVRAIAAENARLAEEKQAADAKAAEERAAREKAEAELKRQADEKAAEEARLAEEKRRAELAPDADKLKMYADLIASVVSPPLVSTEAQGIANEAGRRLKDVTDWLYAQIATMKGDCPF